MDHCDLVTDEGLYFLGTTYNKLSNLNLSSTRITDECLSHLVASSMLRPLDIYFCTEVQGPSLITIALSCNWT